MNDIWFHRVYLSLLRKILKRAPSELINSKYFWTFYKNINTPIQIVRYVVKLNSNFGQTSKIIFSGPNKPFLLFLSLGLHIIGASKFAIVVDSRLRIHFYKLLALAGIIFYNKFFFDWN